MSNEEVKYTFDISEPFIIEGASGDSDAVIARTETLLTMYKDTNQGSSTCEVRYRVLDNNPSRETLFKYRLLGQTLDSKLN